MGSKLAFLVFIMAAIGVGLWLIAGGQESDPSEFVSGTTSTTMDDGSINFQFIIIFIVSIMLVYCFVSIRMALAEERKIWPADTMFGPVADSFLDSTPFVEEEEEEQSHGRVESVETEAEEVMNTKNGEDSVNQSKNKNSETNNLEMVVFTLANEEDDEENSISKVHDSSVEQFADNSANLAGN